VKDEAISLVVKFHPLDPRKPFQGLFHPGDSKAMTQKPRDGDLFLYHREATRRRAARNQSDARLNKNI